MNTTTDQPRKAAKTATPTRLDPEPWTSAKDHEGRHAIARGRGIPRRLAVSVMVDLDAEQSEWLRNEARRTGIDYHDIIKNLLNRERAERL